MTACVESEGGDTPSLLAGRYFNVGLLLLLSNDSSTEDVKLLVVCVVARSHPLFEVDDVDDADDNVG